MSNIIHLHYYELKYKLTYVIIDGVIMECYIENLVVNYISKSIKMNKDEESIIRYGIQIVFYNSYKFAIILLAALFLGIIFEVCTVFIIMATIRSFAFGFHGESSLSCLILTFMNIFGVVYLSLFDLGSLLNIILSLVSFILFAIFAPADTEERPLVDCRKRKNLKITVMLIWFIYIVLAHFVDKQLSNMIILSLFFMAFNTCPILYIIFKKEYNNYEKC